MIPLGISVSDHIPERGFIDPKVYERVNYVEYGGYFPPSSDLGIRNILQTGFIRHIGRHLVSTELVHELDIPAEAARIREEFEIYRPEYLVTDFGYWRLGGRKVNNLWPRPCELDFSSARRIGDNVRKLSNDLGIDVYAENPFALFFEGNLSMTDFLCELANMDTKLCFDIGHYYSTLINSGLSFEKEFDRLPFSAFRVVHISGLSQVEFNRQKLFIDNHNVPPLRDCLNVLSEVLRRTRDVCWITYEAELASTDVQHAGLDAIKKVLK